MIIVQDTVSNLTRHGLIQFTVQATPCSHQLFRSYHRLNSDLKGSDTPAIIAAGLPNITGGLRALYLRPNEQSYYGAIYNGSAGATTMDGNSGNVIDCQVHFDAGRSSAIYGAANTVQPASICLIPQIKY